MSEIQRGPVATAEATTVEHPEQERAQLFAEEERRDLRARWDAIQAGFVDEPRESVQRADGLVTDTIKRLTDGFADERAKLEQEWAKGGDVSTEDLRQALRRYRSFFDRLLSW